MEIIGEALNQAKKLSPSLAIDNFEKIIKTRNIIIHDYDGINYRVIWDVIHNHLGKLKVDVKKALEKI